MRLAACVFLPLLTSCQALLGLFGGAGIGAAATKTPEGAIGGGLAGFIIGGWNDIRNWWLGIWRSWTNGPAAKAESASEGLRGEIVWWALYFAVGWFLYKMAFDYEFRGHVVGFFTRGVNPKPKRKRPNADQSP